MSVNGELRSCLLAFKFIDIKVVIHGNAKILGLHQVTTGEPTFVPLHFARGETGIENVQNFLLKSDATSTQKIIHGKTKYALHLILGSPGEDAWI
eukprot:6469109-Amphidinium_carterae.1